MLTILFSSRHRLACVALAVVAAVVAGWVYLAGQTAAAPEGNGPVPPVSAPSTVATASFKLLREPAARAMPDDVAAEVAGPHRYGRNSRLARSITTETGTGWVIPGRGVLCVAMPDPVSGHATTCVPERFAAQHGLYLGLVDGETGKTRVTLVVPDHATRVRAAEPGGSVSELAIDSDGVVRGTVAGGTTLEVAAGGAVQRHVVGVLEAQGSAPR